VAGAQASAAAAARTKTNDCQVRSRGGQPLIMIDTRGQDQRASRASRE